MWLLSIFALWSILRHVSSDKRMELCCGKILADDQDLDNFHIWLKKLTLGKNRSEDIKNQHHSFQWNSPTPESGLSVLISKCVVPKLNSFQSKALPVAERQHLKMKRAGRRAGTELQRWSLINKLLDGPGPLRVKGDQFTGQEKNTEEKRAHCTAHMELRGGWAVLDMGSWL